MTDKELIKKAALSFIEKDLQDRGAFDEKPQDKEQTLSDKIGWAHECFEEYLHQEDVKEFIKKLKEEARQIHQGKPFYYSSEKKMQFILDKIDKLAGDKLI